MAQQLFANLSTEINLRIYLHFTFTCRRCKRLKQQKMLHESFCHCQSLFLQETTLTIPLSSSLKLVITTIVVQCVRIARIWVQLCPRNISGVTYGFGLIICLHDDCHAPKVLKEVLSFCGFLGMLQYYWLLNS